MGKEEWAPAHVRLGRVRHIFINCSQFAMHGINTKAKEDTSSVRAPRERHVQNYDAKDNRHKAREELQDVDEDEEKSVLRALCLAACLRICGERVQRWRLLRASFYYPSYDTKSACPPVRAISCPGQSCNGVLPFVRCFIREVIQHTWWWSHVSR